MYALMTPGDPTYGACMEEAKAELARPAGQRDQSAIRGALPAAYRVAIAGSARAQDIEADAVSRIEGVEREVEQALAEEQERLDAAEEETTHLWRRLQPYVVAMLKLGVYIGVGLLFYANVK